MTLPSGVEEEQKPLFLVRLNWRLSSPIVTITGSPVQTVQVVYVQVVRVVRQFIVTVIPLSMPPNLFKHLIITVILSTAVALALLSFVSLTPARAGGRKARLVFRTNQASIKYTDVPAIESAEWRPWLHKSGIRVAAIVFYGRRKYVRVLDKYLKRNTWSAGGILGEVWFRVLRCYMQADL